MAANAKLRAAIEVFHELGWDVAEVKDSPNLPLGTPEQQRIVRAGLGSGAWGEMGTVAPQTYGWISWVGVSSYMLTLFAIRCGVSARRSAALLRSGPLNDWSARRADALVNDGALVQILSERGSDFVQTVVQECAANVGVTSTALIRLVVAHQLPVPEAPQYLELWARTADRVLRSTEPDFEAPIAAELIAQRYLDHVRAAITTGIPAAPLASTLAPAVELRWLTRAEAIALAFQALDHAHRPIDRKEWSHTLTASLALSQAELLAHSTELVTVLTNNEPTLIEAFALPLITHGDDEVLAEVLDIVLEVKTKKAQLAVLNAVAQRKRPHAVVVESLAAKINELGSSKDSAISRTAKKVADTWGLRASERSASPVAVIRGLWQATPPLWTVPRFDVGEATPEALTAAAAVLSTTSGQVTRALNLANERFLALANAVAQHSEHEARAALRGVRPDWSNGLLSAHAWVKGTPNPLADRGDRISEPAEAREAAVFAHLGQLPCLLSTPSWIDLRIDPADLLGRLSQYQDAELPVAEGDLFLALLRTDFQHLTDEKRSALAKLTVPVTGQDGTLLQSTAGQLILGYAQDPLSEPSFVLTNHVIQDGWWRLDSVAVPQSLSQFPQRVGGELRYAPFTVVFPLWDRAAARLIEHVESAELGALIRQTVCRKNPLGPEMAINLIGAQRGFHEAAAEDGTLAIIEAWERGLLHPGVADVRYLDWHASQPSKLAALAQVCLELAEHGMLSVVWPVLDGVVEASLVGTRLPAGITEIVETMKSLLAEVQAAIKAGQAPPEALAVPGLRALAQRAGKATGIITARELMALIDDKFDVTAAKGKPESPQPLPQHSNLDFDAIWPAAAGRLPATLDHTQISVEWADSAESQKTLAVNITLPTESGEPVREFCRTSRWYYPIQAEGQFDAQLRLEGAQAANTDQVKNRRWIAWDREQQRLVVHENREYVTDQAAGAEKPPLTTAAVAIVLAALGNDRPDGYYCKSILRDELIGAASVSAAMQTLLTSPDLSPARLAGFIEKEPSTLPYLWPVLVESIHYAGRFSGPPPRWLGRVLDVALWFWPLLAEASRRGFIPAESSAWPGLAEIAARGGSTSAVQKARTLSGLRKTS